MTTHESIGLFLLCCALALLGLQLMAASYHAGMREGRRREASRNLGDMLKEANK
jgi:hypothetical protein